MRRNVKPLAVAAKTFGVAPRPGQRATHLLVHRKKIAARLLDIDEVDDDGMRAGLQQRLGLQGVIGRLVAAPGAAVDEHIDGGVRRGGAKDIEPFVFARPIGDALRRPQDRPRPFAGGDAARDDQRAVRRIDVLVVGVVERLLVHVAPDQWALGGSGLGHFRSHISVMYFDESSIE